jgi:serine/threonine protein kinase
VAILSSGELLRERYEIVRVISSGGMGIVYEARDRNAGRASCAIKQLMAHYADAESLRLLRRKFEDEMRFLAGLRHDGIPRLHDYFTQDDQQFLVMDLIEGATLEQELTRIRKQRRAMLAEDVANDAIALLDILVYLHSRTPPVLHRDIKPANIIRERTTGRLKLLDFGIARAHLGRATTHTQLGTLSYAPLEQIQGHAEPRSDLYGLGATIHHLIAGVESPPLALPPLQQVAPEVDPDLAAIVNRAVAAAPSERFEDATAMRDALLEWRQRTQGVPRPVDDTPTVARGSSSAPTTQPLASSLRERPSIESPTLAALLVTAAALSLAAYSYYAATSSTAPRPNETSVPAQAIVATASPTRLTSSQQAPGSSLYETTLTANKAGASSTSTRTLASATHPKVSKHRQPQEHLGHPVSVQIATVPVLRPPIPTQDGPATQPLDTTPRLSSSGYSSAPDTSPATLARQSTPPGGPGGPSPVELRYTSKAEEPPGDVRRDRPPPRRGELPEDRPEGSPDRSGRPDRPGPGIGWNALSRYKPQLPDDWSLDVLDYRAHPPQKQFRITGSQLGAGAVCNLTVTRIRQEDLDHERDHLVRSVQSQHWEVGPAQSSGDLEVFALRQAGWVGMIILRAAETRPREAQLHVALCQATSTADLQRLASLAATYLMR